MIPIRISKTMLCLAALASAGCNQGNLRPWERLPPGATTTPLDSTTKAQNTSRQPGVLGAVETVPVVGWTGPGGESLSVDRRTAAMSAGPSRQFGSITLTIALRDSSAGLTQYPCTACHQGRKIVMENKRIKDAHQNIQPVHPKQIGSHCATCHASENVELLALQDGQRATMDQPYRLCAQCHFAQVAAWAGGAHGKRLDGWQGRRVVMACPNCHDPHSPALRPRIPFRAPQIERIHSPIPWSPAP